MLLFYGLSVIYLVFVLFSFHSIRIAFMARLIFYVHSVCAAQPSPSLHGNTARISPWKYTFGVGRRTLKSTYIQIVVRRSGVCVYCIDGHEFRSSISSNHKFTFNAFLLLLAVAAVAASSKHHQFSFFYVSRDFAAHTKAEPMQII